MILADWENICCYSEGKQHHQVCAECNLLLDIPWEFYEQRTKKSTALLQSSECKFLVGIHSK